MATLPVRAGEKRAAKRSKSKRMAEDVRLRAAKRAPIHCLVADAGEVLVRCLRWAGLRRGAKGPLALAAARIVRAHRRAAALPQQAQQGIVAHALRAVYAAVPAQRMAKERWRTAAGAVDAGLVARCAGAAHSLELRFAGAAPTTQAGSAGRQAAASLPVAELAAEKTYASTQLQAECPLGVRPAPQAGLEGAAAARRLDETAALGWDADEHAPWPSKMSPSASLVRCSPPLPPPNAPVVPASTDGLAPCCPLDVQSSSCLRAVVARRACLFVADAGPDRTAWPPESELRSGPKQGEHDKPPAQGSQQRWRPAATAPLDEAVRSRVEQLTAQGAGAGAQHATGLEVGRPSRVRCPPAPRLPLLSLSRHRGAASGSDCPCRAVRAGDESSGAGRAGGWLAGGRRDATQPARCSAGAGACTCRGTAPERAGLAPRTARESQPAGCAALRELWVLQRPPALACALLRHRWRSGAACCRARRTLCHPHRAPRAAQAQSHTPARRRQAGAGRGCSVTRSQSHVWGHLAAPPSPPTPPRTRTHPLSMAVVIHPRRI